VLIISAHVLFSKYGLHLPLNRQSTTYAREGIDLDVSTLADWVGRRRRRWKRHVFPSASK
jgi:transposase